MKSPTELELSSARLLSVLLSAVCPSCVPFQKHPSLDPSLPTCRASSRVNARVAVTSFPLSFSLSRFLTSSTSPSLPLYTMPMAVSRDLALEHPHCPLIGCREREGGSLRLVVRRMVRSEYMPVISLHNTPLPCSIYQSSSFPPCPSA